MTPPNPPATSDNRSGRDALSGVLFVGLFSAAVVQLASLPAVRAIGLSPLVIGIVCGMLFGNFLRGDMPAGWNAGVHFSAKRLLRIAVAFYGLNVSVQQIVSIGMPGIVVSLGIVVSTLVVGVVAGRKLFGLDRDTALLTAAGSAICGAAAVLAFESTLRSQPHKSAVAVATVVLFGTLSMFLYPVIYHWGILGFDTRGWGLFIGGTVHEVAQVVATASNIDAATTHAATIVKMTRVALLIPVLLALGFWIRMQARAKGSAADAAGVPIPWFAFGFLLLAGINSLGIIPEAALDAIRRLDVFALTMAMTAMGMETRFSSIRKAGPKVMMLGGLIYVWLFFAGYSLVKWVS